MVTQVHELSELLFKVTSGKINEDESHTFLSDNDMTLAIWDDNFATTAVNPSSTASPGDVED